MTPPAGLPGPILWLLIRLLPGDRRDDILGDLAETHAARSARLGPRSARHLLWREVAILLLWRSRAWRPPRSVRRALDAPRQPTGATNLGRDLLRDLSYGARAMVRRPGFTIAVVAVLGLGIGASTTVLTLVNRIFFQRPAEVVEPQRLLRVYRSWAPGQGGGALQNADYEYYRANATTLSGLAAFGGGNFVASFSTGDAAGDQLRGLFVSANYFNVLGVRPLLGRFFLPEENASPGSHAVVVLSHGFWRRTFGADSNVVGRRITLNGISHTVLGVAPERFQGISPLATAPDTWIPIAMYGALTRARDRAWWERMPDMRNNWLSPVGRIAPGVSFETAAENLQSLSAALTYPGRGADEGILVTRDYAYRPGQATQLASLFKMLVAVVSFVLAIATANAAVLLLSRATARGREIGIRAAMGAGRGRLLRQLLAESLLPGLAGGAVGVGLAYTFSDAAATLLPYQFVGDFAPDLRVLLLAVVLSLVTAVAAGIVPAVRETGRDIIPVMGDTRATGRRSRFRDGLVVGQVALSLVLATGAALFARSFWTARTQDLGFATDRRLILQVDLRSLGYTDAEGRAFLPQSLDRLRQLPGVVSVATSRQIPFRGDWSTDLVPPPGTRPNTPDGTIWIGLNAVSPGYFATMGIPLLRGRPLGPEDTEQSAPAAVVNETLADIMWPGMDPLGKTLSLGEGLDFQVVGLARNASYYELGETPTTQLYVSVAQRYQPTVHFILETVGPPADIAPAAQAALRQLDPELAFGWVSTMDAVRQEITARYRVSAVLVSLFSALALVLAAAGLYAVVSFLVTQRTREMGVRMALGATRARVATEVLRTGLLLAGIGVVVGLICAIPLRRFTTSLLYGVEPSDPWALIGAAVTLIAVGAAASLAPARRATRVDPMEVMRTE